MHIDEFVLHHDLLYRIPADQHSFDCLSRLLDEHPEIYFVSLVGIDMAGNDTDEKIPVSLFRKHMDSYLNGGVRQTARLSFCPHRND